MIKYITAGMLRKISKLIRPHGWVYRLWLDD
jgi:hypothetical protein